MRREENSYEKESRQSGFNSNSSGGILIFVSGMPENFQWREHWKPEQ